MINQFMQKHFKHFNAAACVDAAQGWVDHLQRGGKMFLTMAGAMSTAELGISLSELIRSGAVDAISCTGANLEEDLFNLVAHTHYERIPHYRSLSKEEEQALHERGMNRVTDTCIPEDEAIRRIEQHLLTFWKRAETEGKRYFPHEVLYQLLASRELDPFFEIDPKDSWLYAAWKRDLPIFVPGWEDSTTANIFVAHLIRGNLHRFDLIKSGVEQMAALVDWYRNQKTPIGFFQIGGGIAGDFPICLVPLIRQDLREETPLWSYFCQISESTTSYGSYSGATPNEKITWGKISVNTPSYIIESDATIVAPLIFSYVLEKTNEERSEGGVDSAELLCQSAAQL